MNLARFPFREVTFDKQAEFENEWEVEQLSRTIGHGDVSDLVVISHGWNNDIAEARALYDRFLSSFDQIVNRPASTEEWSNRAFGFVGILWPSKKFADEELIPGGRASLRGIDDQVLVAQLENLKGAFDRDDSDEKLDRAVAIVPWLEDRKTSRDELVDIVRSLLGERAELDEEARVEIPDHFFDASGDELIRSLKAPGLLEPVGGDGVEGAVGLTDAFGGIKAGVRRLLNYVTYWQMKERAGKIGKSGVHRLLEEMPLRDHGVKLHLVGHSFGGRLVTAAAAPPGGPGIDSMSLLQAAFSHNGFARDFDGERDGYFRSVIDDRRVRGPIIITHTANDKTVGVAYALASRFSRDDATALGDKNDRFGAVGRNGARSTPEAQDGVVLSDEEAYGLAGGAVYNLLADDFIVDHSDVTNPAVANAVAHAIRAS